MADSWREEQPEVRDNADENGPRFNAQVTNADSGFCTLFLSRNLFLQMRISLSHFRTSVPFTICWLVSRRQIRKRTCELDAKMH